MQFPIPPDMDFDLTHHPDLLTDRIIGAAVEVHRHLGPGLLESVYGIALEHELLARGVSFSSEVPLTVHYKGATLDKALRIDLLVEDQVVVELKAVEAVLPVHCSQVLTYLRLGGFRRGLLINFNVRLLVDGIRRFVN